MTVIEAGLESLPQLVLQSILFYLHPERINPYVFAFSAGCSLAGLSFAVYNFVSNYEEIMTVLGPPPELLPAGVLSEGFEADAAAWRGGGRKAAQAKVQSSGNVGIRVALSPDASMLVGGGSAASRQVVTIYEPADASVVKVLSGTSKAVHCVATDGVHIACGCQEGYMHVWTAEGEPVGEWPKEHSSAVAGIALLGDLLVSGGGDLMVKLWSVSARTCSATLREHSGGVYAVAVTEEAIATGSADKTARIWPLDGGASRHTLEHPDWVRAVAMAGDVLVTGCVDKVVRTFAVATGQRTRELRGHTGLVSTVALSGSMVVSGGGIDEQVKVWELTGEASAECVATLEGHSDDVYGVVAGPDFVASQAWQDSQLIVWRPA